MGVQPVKAQHEIDTSSKAQKQLQFWHEGKPSPAQCGLLIF